MNTMKIIAMRSYAVGASGIFCLILAGCSALPAPPARPAVLTREPEPVREPMLIKGLNNNHKREEEERIDRENQQLLRRLQDERACVERHGRCHMQYDPWLGPGDGAIGHPLQFRRQAQDAHGAVVVMSYPASAGAAARSVSLKLRRSEDGACWQLDDFITPPGESLAAILDGAAR